MTAVEEGRLLWEPSEERKSKSRLSAYLRFLEETRKFRFPSYAELWRWSVSEVEAFWESIWQYFEVRSAMPYRSVLSQHEMPGARWFAGALVNYAEHALRRSGSGVAVIFRREDGSRGELSWDELRERVARARAGLVRAGVKTGDRVAVLLPNSPEATIAFLATASLGAVFSSCSPEFGVESVLDRFGQIEPKVFIGVDGYTYGGRAFSRAAELEKLAAALSSVTTRVVVSRLGAATPESFVTWDDFLSGHEPLAFEFVPFDHPLWILYSSGTTGLPKPIVQGQGGILLEHLKVLALHSDLGPEDRFFWFTTTGWMMWNFLIGGLLVGSTIVLFEGNPGHPDLTALFRLADEERVTYFGTSAPYLLACRKAGIVPRDVVGLESVRTIGSTGAPLPVEGFEWVYDAVKGDVLLASVAGGTDVCTAFLVSCPLLPVRAAELQCRALGAKVEAFDADGKSVIGSVGELVITEPMPSMPLHFIGDPDGKRLAESYFADFPGVWRHGDWIRIGEGGESTIYGRSDATLNRGGVRMGTAELYRVVEALPDVADSLVVDTGSLETEGKLWLFVVPRPGTELDQDAKNRIRAALRTTVSPRHVPDVIVDVLEIPRTLNGKKLEIPVKRILMGTPIERAVATGTVANPAAIDDIVKKTRPAS
ncbi:MAG TPA: acetoacetate--CoA ligase [Polyangiaceae bacterium]|jgi:acetoacetyl-CoA synthetase|nr:acetoacetate--CoA ligase [Polyangiaceae bacterium]